jgi:hypothetical protein
MRERPGKPHKLSVGDSVLVKQPKRNKLTPAYNPHPAKVIGVKGSMVAVETDTNTVTRDGSKFKKLRREAPVLEENSSEDEMPDEEAEVVGADDVHSEESEDDDAQPAAGASAHHESSPRHESIARSKPQRATAGVPAVRFGDWQM